MTPPATPLPIQRSRALLTLWLLALLLPTLAGVWAYFTTRDAVEERIAGSRCALAKAMAARLRQNLDFGVDLVRGAAARPGMAEAVAAGEAERTRQSLENVRATLPGLRGVAVVERDGGRVFAAHPPDFLPPAGAPAEDLSPGTGVDGKPVLVVRAPVRDSPAMLLVAEVDLAVVGAPIVETALGESLRGTVVDRQGRPAVGGGVPRPPSPAAIGDLLEGWRAGTQFVPGGAGGRRELVALAPLPGYPWAMLIWQGEDEALAPIAVFRRRLWLGLLSLVVTGLGLGALLARRLHRDAARLREEQGLLRTVIEGTSDPVFLKDRDGRYVLANRAFARVIGRPMDEVLGRDDAALFPPEVARSFAEGDEEVLASGATTTAELSTEQEGRRLTLLTSKTPFRDPEGGVQGVIGIARDISKRKDAEDELLRTRDALEEGVRERTAALESANAILKAVFDGTTDAIYVKDLEGRYLLANAAAARALGKRPEEMLGRDDARLFGADAARPVQDQERAIMASGETRTLEHELPVGGEARFFLSTKGPYRDSGGRVIGLIGISRDVTGRRREEEALRQSQKLESLGLLAGGVAHDFNNLLVAMLGQTTLAQGKLGSDHPARENLEKAVKAAERAADLTRQMLAYSGRGHFQIRPVHLNAVIEENLHLLRVAVPKRVRLASEPASDLPWIDADVGQIQQVVMNLITNAAEAIGEGEGTVVVVTGTRTVGPGDAHLWRHTGEPLPPGRYVSLEVRDDGRGMDAATLERIFDPFFTTKFTGRGLGLAAVLGIVRGHKGGLSVESEVSRGTVFRLLFPTSTKAPLPKPRPAETAPDYRTVLVIDDEEVVREAISDALDSRGFHYLLAGDGDEGLQVCRDRGEEIGLVILDLSMPGRSGEDTFRALRRILPAVPVLLSSGYGEEQAKANFAGDDLAGFLQKPYRLSTLLPEVERCLKAGRR